MSCCINSPDPYFGINTNIHVSGSLTDPKLYLFFDDIIQAPHTLQVEIRDLNGNPVSDTYTTIIPPGSRYYVYDLGDFINAQRIAKGLPVGIYILIAVVRYGNNLIDTFATTLVLSSAVANITPTPELVDIIVIDKWTGVMFRSGPIFPADSRFQAWVYYHKEDKGRIVIYDSGIEIYDTGYNKLVYVRIVKRFPTLLKMIEYMISSSYLPPYVMREIVRMIHESEENLPRIAKAIAPYYVSKSLMPGYIGTRIDIERIELIDEILMPIGWIDWNQFINSIHAKLTVAGCLVGAGLAVVATIKTAGIGLPLLITVAKGCGSGALLGMGASLLFSSSTPQPPEHPTPPPLPPTIPEHQQLFDNNYNEMVNMLTDWKNNNRITEDEFNKAMKHLENMRTAYYSTLNDMVEYAKRAFDEGYKKGYKDGYEKAKSEYMTHVIGAGIGGLVIGVIIGKR